MADQRSPAHDELRFTRRLPGARRALLVGLPIVLLATIALARPIPVAGPQTLLGMTAGAQDATPAQLTAAAAGALEAATAKAGGGYRFEIIQTSTMVAKDGGPKIPVPNRIGRGTAELVDRYFLHSVIEQGVVRPDGFWSQMRAGPAEGAKPDWDGSEVMFEALVRDGARWRNDGDGWYEADTLPGIGLDPETAALLPTLLRGATDKAADLPPGDEKIDPEAARNLEAEARTADIPGVVAADGLDFTELIDKIAYGFDDAGRLTTVTVSARNTNMTDFDLVIETVIYIAYEDVGGLPEPKPVWDGEVD